MNINLSTELEYIPSWNGNKQEVEPITIVHLPATINLYNSLIPKPAMKVVYDDKGQFSEGSTEVVIDNTRIVQAMVTTIRNLTITDGDKVIKITTGKELFGPNVPAVLSGLIDEIGAYLQGVLNNKSIDTKN